VLGEEQVLGAIVAIDTKRNTTGFLPTLNAQRAFAVYAATLFSCPYAQRAKSYGRQVVRPLGNVHKKSPVGCGASPLLAGCSGALNK
jgi:hypothetical protein